MFPTTAEDTRPPAAAVPNDLTSIARHGHEPSRIAQPSTFLLPRGQNRAMQDKPLTAIDKDQLSGLVSSNPSHVALTLFMGLCERRTSRLIWIEPYRMRFETSSRNGQAMTFYHCLSG